MPRSGGRPVPATWLDPVAASPLEIALGGFLLVGLGLLGLVWGAGFFSALLINQAAPELSVGDAGVAIARMGSNRLSWSEAWSPEVEASLAGPVWFWIVFVVETVLLGVIFWPLWRMLGPRVPDPMPVIILDTPEVHPRAARRRAAQQARQERRAAQAAATGQGVGYVEPTPAAPDEVDKILIDQPDGSRLVLGRSGSKLVATEKHHSVLAFGPSQSGKTSGLALPAILEWKGPVVVTAAKSDLITLAWNERVKSGGVTWLFDPSGSMALPGSGSGAESGAVPRLPAGGHGWSPLQSIESVARPRNEPELDFRVRQWSRARRGARWMIAGARVGPGTNQFPGPCYGVAEQMLAPMLLAAAAAELPINQLSEWVDRREDREVRQLLERTGVAEALAGWEGAHLQDAATTAGCYQILTAVMYPFGDPNVTAQAQNPSIDTGKLLDGRSNTLFILSPSHQQERLRSLLATIISEVAEEAMNSATASAHGKLSNPLLLVLDDAAGCTPVELIDQLAAMGAGMGIQLLTMFQDLGRVSQAYGPQSAISLANSHRARLVLPGITDATTLDYLNSTIRGNRLIDHDSGASGMDGAEESIVSPAAGWMRTLKDGAAVVIYGNLAPIRITLRPWFEDQTLHGRLRPTATQDRRWPWRPKLRKRRSSASERTPSPFDSEANDAESARYWESVRETGLLPEARPYDDGTGPDSRPGSSIV